MATRRSRPGFRAEQPGLPRCEPESTAPRITAYCRICGSGAVGSSAQHAILILAQLRHRAGKPNAAIDDQAQPQEGDRVVQHPVAIIVVLAARIFAYILDGRTPGVMIALIVVTGLRNPRPE